MLVPCIRWKTHHDILLLRSAVGKTHVLRSGLVMDYTTSYFPLIVLGYPLDSKRSYGPLPDTLCPGPCIFPPQGSSGQFGPITGLVYSKSWFHSLNQLPIRLVPSSSYLRVYMGCALAIVFQVRSLYVP